MFSHLILRPAEIFASHRGITLPSLGTYALRDASFFVRLRDGRVTLRRAEEILGWLSDHWPADLAWPADIPRPTPDPDATPLPRRRRSRPAPQAPASKPATAARSGRRRNAPVQ